MVSKIEVGDRFVGEHGEVEVTNTRVGYLMNFLRDVLIIDFKYIDLEIGEEFRGSYSIYSFKEKFKSKVKNNRLAKKMFPNAEESEDGEWLYV